MIQNENTATGETLYDLSMLEEMDDNEYLSEVLHIFLKETPLELKEMKQALNSGNNEVVAKKAHKLKSSAGVIQANKLIELLDGIEINAKKGVLGEELISLVENARKLYTNIEFALHNHLKNLAM